MAAESNQTALSYSLHRQAVYTMVSDLKRLQELSTRLETAELAALITESRLSLENNTFSVAVVGEFKRGKSTFINALLGKEILPSDILPTTATINRVRYGLTPSVEIIFKGDNGEDGGVEYIGIDQLDEYVTKRTQEAEEMAATIKEAVVYYPVSYCKNNVDIIDTPGLSDDETMTNVTLSVLPKVDAAIMVVMATAPFAETESNFLDQLLIEQGLGSVIFVVTALDRLRRVEEQERALAQITERIKQSIVEHGQAEYGPDTEAYHLYLKRVGEPRVFGLSGYLALQGKTKHDEALLAESRFPEFETMLENFLTGESGAIALKTHAERIIGFSKELLKKLAAQEALLQKQPEAFKRDHTIIEALLTTLEQMGREEMRQVDRAIGRARERLRPRLDQATGQLKKAAEDALNSANISTADLEEGNSERLLAQLVDQINTALQKVCDELAAELQQELRTELAAEIIRLHAFATTIDRTLRHVALKFSRFEAGTLGGPRDGSEQATATFSMVARLNGPASFDQAGAEQQSIEAILGDVFEESRPEIASTLKPSSAWIASLEIDVNTSSGGGFMQKVTGLYRTESFKRSYKKTVLDGLEQWTTQQQGSIQQYLSDHTATIFEPLKREIETALNQVRGRQVELGGKQARVQALNEREHKALQQMQAELQQIQQNAQTLSNQLVEITAK